MLVIGAATHRILTRQTPRRTHLHPTRSHRILFSQVENHFLIHENMIRPDRTTQTLERGLDLLLAFSEQQPTLSVAELADASGLPLSTTYRLVQTLDARYPRRSIRRGSTTPSRVSAVARHPGVQ